MQMLASDASLDAGPLDVFREKVMRALPVNRDWRNVVLIDPKSHLIVFSGVPMIGAAPLTSSAAEVDDVTRTRTGKIVGLLAAGKIFRQPVVQFLMPVVRANEVRFVLSLVVNPTPLSDLFAAQRIPLTWTGAVIDNRMMIAGRSRDPQKYVGVRATPTLVSRIAASDAGMFTALNQEGNAVYTVFSRSPLTGWSVVIGIPGAEIDGPIQRTLMLLGLAGACLIVFALMLAALVGRAILVQRKTYDTALQEIQSKLQIALTEFKELVTGIPVGIYKLRMAKDGSNRFDYVSPRFCEQIGVTQGQIQSDSEPTFNWVLPEDLPEVIRLNELALRSLQPFVWEGRVLGPQGTRWMHVEATAVELPDGDILWNGTQFDITERMQIAAKLNTLMREQKAILNNGLVGIVTVRDRTIIWANPAFEQMMGFEPGKLAGMPTRQNYPSDEAFQSFGAVAYPVLAAGDVFRARTQFVRKDGQHIWVDVSGEMLDQETGQSLWGFADITERKNIEDRLRQLSVAVEQSPVSVVVTDLSGSIEYVNARFTEATGYSATDVMGQNPRILKSGLTSKETYEEMWTYLSSGRTWQGEIVNRRKNGEHYWEDVQIAPVKNPMGVVTHYVAVKSDITERKQLEEQIRKLAFYDPLTNLPNRRLLMDRLAQTLAAGKRSDAFGALIFLDLDNFKPLNDEHGHGAGDLLLVEVAGRLRGCVRAVDTVSRLGGDEFVVLLGDLTTDQDDAAEQANRLAEKILVTLAQPYVLATGNELGTIEHRCSASLGVVLFSKQHQDLENLLKWADAAMYRSKAEGRNRITFMVERRAEQRA